MMRILIVDDVDFVRAALEELLSHAGHSISVAASGAEALTLLHNGPFDVVLTDLRMPGIDGLELLREVRAAWPATDVIIMTGFASVAAAIQALREGAFAFLEKPIAYDDVLHHIDTLQAARIAGRSNSESRSAARPGRSEPQDASRSSGHIGQDTLATVPRSPTRAFLDTALPELVASFCHDIGNHLFTVETAAVTARELCGHPAAFAPLVGAVARTQDAIQAMRAFLRPLRRESDEPPELVALLPGSLRRKIREIIRREVFDPSVRCALDLRRVTDGRDFPLFLLELILAPLLQNAQKAIANRDGRIMISLATPRLEAALQLMVSDDGPGWNDQKEALLAHIHDPHWPSQSRLHAGEGLRNVYRLARLLGGGISLHDSKGHGARVKVVLPL